jgi:hypothetical protein
MKHFLFITLIFFVLVLAFEARSFSQDGSENSNRRFLGSVTSWFNDNVINPISGGINTGINAINNHVINPIGSGITTGINTLNNFFTDTIPSGLNTALNTISDPFISFGNMLQGVVGTVGDFFSNTLVNAVNDALNTVKDQALNVVDLVSGILFPNNNQPGHENDACQATCISRINLNNQVTEYSFDKANGCISKGFIDPSVKIFDDCCDAHNKCLNSKCCTDDCQKYKNECDSDFEMCTKQVCLPFYLDNLQFYPCLAKGSYLASSAVNRTCNPNTTKNRKLCYCHIQI